MKYDLEKPIFLLEKYIKFEKISTVQHAYRSKYKNEPVPDHSTIMGSKILAMSFPIKKQPREKRE